ncbi:MAG TPA: hypothetical protein VNA20_00600 [Frankiaceae bacterium]|nr:hypothetical protein [Frankiaceae bacterium]
MNLRKSVALVAPLALGGLVASAHAAPPAAAPKPLVVTDQTGDANAVNDAGLLNGDPIPSGTKTDPASLAQFDVKSFSIGATGAMATRKVGKKKVKYFNCTGFTATIELADAPSTTASLYRVQAATQKLSQFWLEFRNPAGGAQSTKLRFTAVDPVTGQSSTKSVDLKVPAKVVESKVVFTVGATDLKQAGEALGKTILSAMAVDVRSHLNAATLPMWDEAVADEAAAWKVCPV